MTQPVEPMITRCQCWEGREVSFGDCILAAGWQGQNVRAIMAYSRRRDAPMRRLGAWNQTKVPAWGSA